MIDLDSNKKFTILLRTIIKRNYNPPKCTYFSLTNVQHTFMHVHVRGERRCHEQTIVNIL